MSGRQLENWFKLKSSWAAVHVPVIESSAYPSRPSSPFPPCTPCYIHLEWLAVPNRPYLFTSRPLHTNLSFCFSTTLPSITDYVSQICKFDPALTLTCPELG